MADRDESVAAANPADVSACVQTLNRTIGQLANRYGAAPVVAALTEVVGCSSCVDDASRGASIRTRMQRTGIVR
jgi:hypothetical protein